MTRYLLSAIEINNLGNNLLLKGSSPDRLSPLTHARTVNYAYRNLSFQSYGIGFRKASKGDGLYSLLRPLSYI
ncbi:hypothetical protein ACTXT7_006134 [Hymenolepis weldensis]